MGVLTKSCVPAAALFLLALGCGRAALLALLLVLGCEVLVAAVAWVCEVVAAAAAAAPNCRYLRSDWSRHVGKNGKAVGEVEEGEARRSHEEEEQAEEDRP